MNMIALDLDGVLRDLNHYMVAFYGGGYPSKWEWRYGGRDICTAIEHSDALIKSPPTDYFKHLLKYTDDHVATIMSMQPLEWRPQTNAWIHKHMGHVDVIYFDTLVAKKSYVDSHPMFRLVEDYPYFNSYDNVILIDYPYNRNADAPVRVKDAVNLVLEIERWLKSGQNKNN